MRLALVPGMAALALASLAAPALGADAAQISCPLDSMSAAELEGVSAWVGRLGSREEEVAQPFFRSVADCTRRHGWSQREAMEATGHNGSVLGQREVRRILERGGIDVAPIERVLVADRATLDAVARGEGREAIPAFQNRLDADLRSRLNAARLEGELATFLVFRAVQETSRERFARQ